jgi:glycosyltransferase involved in cell wall biosynthesis
MKAELWPGPVVAAMFPEKTGSSGNLDDEYYAPASLPFDLRVVGQSHADIFNAVQDADVVQFGGDDRLRALPRFCKKRGIRFVWVSEYTLRTRLQIVAADVINPVIKLRRAIWELGQEIHNRRAVRMASAVQCNGTPTFEIYSRLNPNSLLYFDSRIDSDMIAKNPGVGARAKAFDSAKPIRLAFSGRLNRMKGADDLIEVARILQEAKFPFSLDIFGDGPIAPDMNDRIQSYGLSEKVKMRGIVDFTTKLVPYIKGNVDLFVCCHRQGDPSCTYIETFACGVPIVGYANEALHGILRREDIGWITPLNKPGLLANKIMQLAASPAAFTSAGSRALDFAQRHTFEREFRERINHMRRLVES